MWKALKQRRYSLLAGIALISVTVYVWSYNRWRQKQNVYESDAISQNSAGIVYANGIATETFYPGPWAIETLASHSKLSLLAQFPGYDLHEIAAVYGPPNAPYAKKRDLAKQLAALSFEKIDDPSCSFVSAS